MKSQGKTRRYPWEIQQLVSTHQLPHKSSGRGGSPDQLRSQVPRSAQIFIGGGGWGGGTPDQLKSPVPRSPKFALVGGGSPDQLKFQVPRSAQIFILLNKDLNKFTLYGFISKQKCNSTRVHIMFKL